MATNYTKPTNLKEAGDIIARSHINLQAIEKGLLPINYIELKKKYNQWLQTTQNKAQTR